MRRMLLTFFLALTITLPVFISAAADPCATPATSGNFVPLACYKGTPLENIYNTNATDPNALGKFLNRAFQVIISVAAVAAVIRGGIAMWLYMGTDKWSRKGQAREVIQDVALGLILLLGTFLIFYQINPCILNFNILQTFTGGQDCPV